MEYTVHVTGGMIEEQELDAAHDAIVSVEEFLGPAVGLVEGRIEATFQVEVDSVEDAEAVVRYGWPSHLGLAATEVREGGPDED